MDISGLLKDNLNRIQERIAAACQRSRRDPEEVRLLPVSKYVGVDVINNLLNMGCDTFGENRIQQALPKIEHFRLLEKAPFWHFIGKIQSNKVTKIIGNFELIHSVDSLDILEKIQKRALELNLRQKILLQTKDTTQASKSGISNKEDLQIMIAKAKEFSNIHCTGLMTMTDACHTPEEIRSIFRRTKELGDSFKALFNTPSLEFSMGMSSDFEIAIEEGATLIRIGSLLYEGIPL